MSEEKNNEATDNQSNDPKEKFREALEKRKRAVGLETITSQETQRSMVIKQVADRQRCFVENLDLLKKKH